MQTNIYLTDGSEERLKLLKRVAVINGLNHSKGDLINLAIKIASESINLLDEESFEQVTNLKK